MAALRASSTITQTQIHWGKVDATLRSPVAAAVSLARQTLSLERRALYLRLTSCLNESQRCAFYVQLGLDARGKKRKLLLSQTVWSSLAFEHARDSAQVVWKVNAAALSNLEAHIISAATSGGGSGGGGGGGGGGIFGIGRRSGGGSNADGLVERCLGLGLGSGTGAEAGADVGRDAWANRVLAEYSHRAHRYAVCAMLQRGKG